MDTSDEKSGSSSAGKAKRELERCDNPKCRAAISEEWRREICDVEVSFELFSRALAERRANAWTGESYGVAASGY